MTVNPELVYSACGALVGSSVSVWAVFRVMLARINDNVADVRRNADAAHKRLDRHMDAHQAVSCPVAQHGS